MNEILVGTDGSASAKVAGTKAIAVASKLNARLRIVGIYRPPNVSAEVMRTIAAELQAQAGRAGVDSEIEIKEGDAPEELLGLARQSSPELIVIGDRGMRPGKRPGLGNNADRVSHRAPRDLLIVRSESSTEDSYRKIMVATDGSISAFIGVRKAFELAKSLGASLTLVFVGNLEIGQHVLDDTAKQLTGTVQIDKLVLEGDPADQICEAARSEACDLVVVGNKRMSGAMRILRTVPNKVSHNCPCDVYLAQTSVQSALDLRPGEGAIVVHNGVKFAAYRDENGAVHTSSPRCTHMGCLVDWNGAAKTWDCPCHGSRFSLDGEIVSGPATKPLEKMTLDGELVSAIPLAPATRPEPEKEPAIARPGPAGQRVFVIIGASLAGATAAAKLREEGFDGRIILIGEEGELPYERPPLSKQFLRGELAFEKLLIHPAGFYPGNGIETLLGTKASKIEAGDRRVHLTDGSDIAYDKLLITTGSTPRKPQLPGIDLDGVFDLRTKRDAEKIQSAGMKGRRALMIGMGFIGCEVAASLRQRGVEVTAIESGKLPLERILGTRIAQVLQEIHLEKGVETLLEDSVASFEGADRLEAVVTTGGRKVECDFAVMGVGVEPAVAVTEGSPIAVNDGILVDEYCRTNVDDIYAAGDVARHFHPLADRRMRVEHYQHAALHGPAAAMAMLGKAQPYEEVHWFWSDQYEHNLQYTGLWDRWDELVIEGNLSDRKFLGIYLREGKVAKAIALNRGEEISRITQMIRSGADFKRQAEASGTVAESRS